MRRQTSSTFGVCLLQVNYMPPESDVADSGGFLCFVTLKLHTLPRQAFRLLDGDEQPVEQRTYTVIRQLLEKSTWSIRLP
jgi:hypothetical protein